MDEEKKFVESSAPTAEEAISKGLEELGLSRNDVEVEILDDGNRGLFGLGSREARVRLTVKANSDTPSERKSEEISSSKPQSVPVAEKQADKNRVIKERKPEIPSIEEEEPQPELVESPVEEYEQDEKEYILTVSRETIVELLEKMQVEADVSVQFAPDSHTKKPTVLVEITGEDLSILIGRRAETLNAIQYITRLIVGKELSRRVYLQVDVEGYRKRRERQLRRLARRMADQAINTGRNQVLEPMPPNERRLVHIELRDHPDVYTESVGEGNRRKVTIRLKN